MPLGVLLIMRIPHASGGDPVVAKEIDNVIEYSPRKWG